MKRKGLVQVYTGDGKGKTTAAIGLAVRAAASGMKAIVISFNKSRPVKSGEHITLKELGIRTEFFAGEHPAFFPDTTREKMISLTKKGTDFALEIFKSLKYDIIVLDEILISVRDGFLSEKALLDIIDKKPVETELVLTGRGATPGIIARADLVSDIRDIKHPYRSGTGSRKGIEK
ncbi:MAG: cob(I)yrinic acid a,c-diamide adenosyltransferase [Elusimicrobia bacterium]|nr:cob(I)yrinic acid a,c-diamide adenosyltransferase [Elusimicrobiota bacterium]